MIVPPKKSNTWGPGVVYFSVRFRSSFFEPYGHTPLEARNETWLFCHKVAEAEDELRKLQDMNEGH